MQYVREDSTVNDSEKARVNEILREMNSKNRKKFWYAKRFIDIAFASICLLLFSVPMVLIACIIFLGDGHSPIFTQQRVGRHGKVFILYKFRTMVADADKMLDSIIDKNEMDGPAFKIKNDPRITKFGRFLRKTSLDELPQFINVIKGDMTVIGPRPPLVREVEQYTELQKIRLTVTPGITCLWQVSPKRNEMTFDEWFNLDIEYILHRSILMDIKIMFLTVWVMFRGEGQ